MSALHETELLYNYGFDSYQQTEAIPGSLPIGRNNPQKPPHGLICEKLSGTAFTAPRKENKQSFLYRILPAVVHGAFSVYTEATGKVGESGLCDAPGHLSADDGTLAHLPNQLRWSPFEIEQGTFVSGLSLLAASGSPQSKEGLAIYIYTATEDMPQRQCLYSADGDMLIVPQLGTMILQTELGKLTVAPSEVAIVPRGIRFRTTSQDKSPLRGYIMEAFGPNHFELPELGVIGSYGCANARDFQIPVAAYDEDYGSQWEVVAKYTGKLFSAYQNHTPFDVVAWHGNYYPCKYDLKKFNAVGSVSYDHLDPSIFTVLTCQSAIKGTAIADFVVIPSDMWVVAEDTYRPPWFHRNCMSEFMGLISGRHGAKSGNEFAPGGASLHSIMSGHGPDAGVHNVATNMPLSPMKVPSGSLGFMFETSLFLGITNWGLKTCGKLQNDYNSHWEAILPTFSKPETAGSGQELMTKGGDVEVACKLLEIGIITAAIGVSAGSGNEIVDVSMKLGFG